MRTFELKDYLNPKENININGTDYEYQNGKYILYRFTKDEQENLVTEVLHEGYEGYEQIVVRPLGNK